MINVLSSYFRPVPAGDPILHITGSFGRYQLILCCIVFLTKFFIAFHQMAIIFLNPKVTFKCDEVEKKCPCENPVFESEFFTNTMAMEWNLVCERLSLASLQQATFQFGVLFGSVGFGMAADSYGRKKPLLISIIIQIVCGVGAALSHDFWVFLILRVFVGLSVGGTMTTSFVIVMEFVGPQYREVLSALYQVPFNVGHFLLPVIAYFVRDYNSYQMAVSAPGLIMLSCFWCPDTPRWLIGINRTEEACRILTKAAKMNNRPTEEVKTLVEAYHQSLGSSKGRKGTILDLFRTKNIRKNTICMSINWLACSYCFYGVSQYVGQLMGNPFLNVGASALLTTMATLTSIPVLKVVGRRTILIWNNRPTEEVKTLVEAYHQSLGSSKGRKGTILDLFRTKNIRKNTICMSINWLACSYCFYGVSQYVGQLMGNPFLNVGASALLTTMATLTSIPVLKVVGRRTILIVGNGTAALCLVLLGILPPDVSNGPVSIVLATIGVMASFIVFITVYLYTSELFPTVIRNAAVGLASSSARVGSIIAPFVIDLQDTAQWLPPVCFATLPAIACLVSFYLPETKGCRLMATIAEAEAFGTKDQVQA